ncbi:surfeit locus 1 family protein [Actimicrobium sp. GrIS 1.19]|uniref:SURF1 family protein n=1 Tax=Actimicrobium sp. GrIS 1.19 TaxID=3071708 RepID=UPI002E053C1E|nr:surfeit locus 1 family protein [Actimicrobium sp. GrIS 1.19]
MRIRFHFRLIPFVAAVLLVALGIVLAQWQIRRAHEKQQIEAQSMVRSAAPAIELTGPVQDVDALEFRRVTVRGHFVAAWPLYLDNRPQDGRPGFYVLMPFKLSGSDAHVLVERGWIGLNLANRTQILPYRTPAEEIVITGIVRRQTGHVMQLGSAAKLAPGAILQNLNNAELRNVSGLPIQPFVIEQANTPQNAQDGLVRNWPVASSGIERHQGYAFQWYALALMAFLFFVVTGFRREPS